MAREFKDEMVMSKFKPFANGKVNCHVPHHYNWALGYPVPPMHEGRIKPVTSVTIADRRANYHAYGD